MINEILGFLSRDPEGILTRETRRLAKELFPLGVLRYSPKEIANKTYTYCAGRDASITVNFFMNICKELFIESAHRNKMNEDSIKEGLLSIETLKTQVRDMHDPNNPSSF
jgi:hypothetical protein